MAGIVLNVEVRERTGTGGARATRGADLLPGVLYGGPRGAIPIELNKKEVLTALRSGKFVSHLIEISHKGERQPVIPKAIQYHPVSDQPIHIDLYRVEENSEIDIEVPVHFQNQEASPGLKRGGVLNIIAHTLKLRVPALKIPEQITVDLAGLEIGAAIHLSAINLPAGAKVISREKDLTIATIAGRAAEEPESGAAEGAAPAEGEKKEG